MNNTGKGPWPHFNFDVHITNLHQDDPRALPGRGEFRAFALPPPGVEEPNLHPRRVLTRLAPVVVPALHFHTHLLELVADEGMDPFHAFIQLTCVALPWGSIGTLRRRAAQQINGSPQLLSLHEQRSAASGGSMLTRSVGH